MGITDKVNTMGRPFRHSLLAMTTPTGRLIKQI